MTARERSARWLRVSTNKKSHQQDENVTQLSDVSAWETLHGYDVKETFTVRVTAFKGNTTFDREWAKVLDAFRTGKITVLVVWKLDRLDRKQNAYTMIKQAAEVGGRIEFVKEPYLNDLSAPGSRHALIAHEDVAFGESKSKQERAIATRNTITANGGILSRPPFGYAVAGPKYGKYFVIVESLRAIVETIFAKCITGDSLVTIAKWLDSEGIPTARGGKWSNTALKNIINNTAYMGYIQDNDGKVIGTCPAIIDAGTHKAANNALKKRPKRGPILAENRALCAGVLYCPNCGGQSPMYRLASNDGPRNPDGTRNKAYFYRCAGRGAQRKGCGNMVRLNLVDKAVDKIMSTTTLPIIKRVFVPGRNHAAEIADVDFRISQLSPAGKTRQEFLDEQNALWDEKESYEHMKDIDDDWAVEPVKDSQGNVVTYASKWNAADGAGRQAMLKETTIYATREYVVIELIDDEGHEILRRMKLDTL
jgi:site-specific DNA recombinase